MLVGTISFVHIIGFGRADFAARRRTQRSDTASDTRGQTCITADVMLDWAGGFYDTIHSTFGDSSVPNGGITEASVVVAQPLDACTQMTNRRDAAGKVVLSMRGDCAFTTKASHAEQAGAVAIGIRGGRRADAVDVCARGRRDWRQRVVAADLDEIRF